MEVKSGKLWILRRCFRVECQRDWRYPVTCIISAGYERLNIFVRRGRGLRSLTRYLATLAVRCIPQLIIPKGY